MKNFLKLSIILVVLSIIVSCRADNINLADEQPKTLLGKWNLVKLDYVTYNQATGREVSRVPFRDYSTKNIYLTFKDIGKGDLLDYVLYNNAFNFTYTDRKLSITYLENSLSDKYLNGHGDYTLDGDYLHYVDNYNVDPTFPSGTNPNTTYNRYVFMLKRVPY